MKYITFIETRPLAIYWMKEHNQLWIYVYEWLLSLPDFKISKVEID